MSMGTWKKRIFDKARKASRNGKHGRCKIRWVSPPAEGWPGGDPSKNGYKGGK